MKKTYDVGMSYYINDLWRRDDDVQVQAQSLAECRCPLGVEERREGRVLSRVLHLRQARKPTQRGALGHGGLRDQVAAKHCTDGNISSQTSTHKAHALALRGSPPEVV